MSKFPIAWLALFCFMAASAFAQPEGQAKNLRGRRQGTILYQMREAATPAQIDAAVTVLNRNNMRQMRKLVGGRVRQSAATRLRVTEEQLCAQLMATGAVAFAEPDYLVATNALPNDPSYGSQWFHGMINTPAAWDITTGSSSVIVAVCDGGVEATHPDLVNNMMLPGLNTVDNSQNTAPVNSHGTQVAGCIAAMGNNGKGVAGVTWNVKILPMRVTNRSDGYAYTSDISEAIRWAADKGAKVANVSYDVAFSSTIDSAAKYMRSKGGLVFVAAGNSGADKTGSYPDFASFFTVGATTSSDAKASWSNYGECIDVVAPGASIYTTSTGGGYASVSGTSFASPITAGVAALIYSANPTLSATEVESILLTTCDDLGAIGEDNVFGKGRINAAAAVAEAVKGLAPTPTPEPEPEPVPTPQPPTAVVAATPISGKAPLDVAFDGRGSSDPDGTIASYAWSFGDGATASGSTAARRYSTAGIYTATLTVTDNSGLSASSSVVITVEPSVVRDVAVTAVKTPASAEAGTEVSVEVVVENRGTETESFSLNLTNTTSQASLGTQTVSAMAPSSTRTLTFIWDTTGLSAGSYTLTATAPSVVGETNTANNSSGTSVSLVAPNLPPEPEPEPEPEPTPQPPVAVATATPISGKAPLDVAFDGRGSSDPDGTIASYAWSFGDGATASGSTAARRYSTAGIYTATLTVTDNSGLSASSSVVITVEPPVVHDIAVKAVKAPASAKIGAEVSVEVVVENRGTETESFSLNLTNKTGKVSLGTQTVQSMVPSSTRTLTFIWDTTGLSAGSCTLTATASTVTGETNTANNSMGTALTLAVSETPVIRVDKVEIRFTKAGKNVKAAAGTLITDSTGAPVAGATVTGTWSGILTGTQTVKTDRTGKAFFAGGTTKTNGAITFTVNNVVKAGCTYDDAENIESSASALTSQAGGTQRR